MVAQLRQKADDAAIPVVLGDMATTVAAGNYSLVYLVFNTISNLLTQAEQVSCFRNAARHLVPGGRFVIELSVRDLRKLPPGQKAVVWQAEPGYIGLDTYDVVVSHHFKFGEGRQSRVFRTPHRYIWPAELDLMAQLAGFELESRTRTGSGLNSLPSHVRTYPSIEYLLTVSPKTKNWRVCGQTCDLGLGLSELSHHKNAERSSAYPAKASQPLDPTRSYRLKVQPAVTIVCRSLLPEWYN